MPKFKPMLKLMPKLRPWLGWHPNVPTPSQPTHVHSISAGRFRIGRNSISAATYIILQVADTRKCRGKLRPTDHWKHRGRTVPLAPGSQSAQNAVERASQCHRVRASPLDHAIEIVHAVAVFHDLLIGWLVDAINQLLFIL